ncbi:MAG: glycosyltransferase [Bacilli bacterium]
MESQTETLRVAIVHEWLINFRGSEKVLMEFARMFPDAVIYASVLRRSELPEELAEREIRTTFIQRLPWAHRLYQKYLFLMPLAYARLDMSQYDLVITSSHACANGVRPRRGATHISYCYTPMRYAWSGYEDYRNSLRSPIARVIMSVLMRWMRRWDYTAAQRVTHYIACSSEVSDRIKRYYRRKSSVIFPPVTMHASDPQGSIIDLLPELNGNPYYLSLGRLVPYKRVDLAIEACNRLGRRLVIAGSGPELDRLRALRSPVVHFITSFSDDDAKLLYKNCSGFLFPGEEDFGLTLVEAQLYGKPVVAYGRGGAVDTVIHMKAGVLFDEQTPEAVA